MEDFRGDRESISGKFPGFFRDISGIFPGKFRESSGNFPGIFREISGKFPVLQRHPGIQSFFVRGPFFPQNRPRVVRSNHIHID